MTTMIVLFNLRDSVSEADYEAWAKTTDLPIVRGLKSIDSFSVVRTFGVLGSDAKPPFRYVEIVQINDMNQLGSDASSETMQRVAGEFQALADNPIFMLAESIEG
jgi:REDY-like protein HapK